MAEYIEREALLKHAHIGMTRVSDTEWQKGYWDKEQPYTFQIEVSKKIESEIRAKVIKEFAERLKNKIISDTAYGCDCNQHSGYYDYRIKIGDIPEYIDNLVKEMGGEGE